MDFTKYANTQTAPRKQDFQTVFWYRSGKCVAKKVGDEPTQIIDPRVGLTIGGIELGACVKETSFDEAALSTARVAYLSYTKALMVAFKQDLFDELGIAENPKRDRLYELAWEYGHDNGFSSVYHYASDLVDLI